MKTFYAKIDSPESSHPSTKGSNNEIIAHIESYLGGIKVHATIELEGLMFRVYSTSGTKSPDDKNKLIHTEIVR